MTLRHTGLIALLLFTAGCSPAAKVERYSPADYNLGQARHFVLVQMNGRPVLRDMLLVELQRELRQTDWWRFEDRQAAGIAVKVVNAKAEVDGDDPGDNEIFARIDVYEGDVEQRFVRKKDQKWTTHDREVEQRIGSLVAEVSFGVTLMASGGRVIMAEREYAAEYALQKSGLYRDAALAKAFGIALQRFIADITPDRVRESIRLDDDAEDMKDIAKIVKNGAYAVAEKDLEALRDAHPERADIAYNLAVVKDASGKYDEALALYDTAMKLGYKKYYAKSRAACARRKTERDALNTTK